MKLNLIMKKKKKSENVFEKIKNNLTKQINKLTDNLNKSELNLKNTKDELKRVKYDNKKTIDKLTKDNLKMQKEKKIKLFYE